MSATDPVTIPGIPFELSWLIQPLAWEPASDGLTITTGPRCDWFSDPSGVMTAANAPALLGTPTGDFVLSARVEVEFASSFDAGVLMLWDTEQNWAKLCFEHSPQGQPMIVSVVTRGLSDDCNSIDVDGNTVWLRIARVGQAYAFHASTDAQWWHFVRYFTLPGSSSPRLGFEAQSPTGESCTVRFTEVRFDTTTLANLRDGS